MVERSLVELEKQMIAFTTEARSGKHFYLNVIGENKGVLNADSFFGLFPTTDSTEMRDGLFVYTHYRSFADSLCRIKNLPLPEKLAGINFRMSNVYLAKVNEAARKEEQPLVVLIAGTFKETDQYSIWLFCRKGLNPKEAYFAIRNECISLIAKQN